MEIEIFRLDWSDKGLFGHLRTDKGFDCVTLERTAKAIPPGRYKLTMYDSPKFKRKVPLLNGVPGRTYVEMHPADYQEDLEGCIALASRRPSLLNTDYSVFASDNNKETFNKFMEHIKGVDEIWLTIK